MPAIPSIGSLSRSACTSTQSDHQFKTYLGRATDNVQWTDNNDVILWDNTCVMHRATGGTFEGKHVRDMRRATVHDGSIHAWGLNEQSTDRMGYP